MPFGDLLYNEMNEKGISTKELSDKMNKEGEPLDVSYISKILSNKVIPSDKKIKVLAKVLKCKYEYLNIEAYFDRAPPEIKNVLEIIRINSLKNISENWNKYKDMSNTSKKTEKIYHKLSRNEIINQLNHMPISKMLILMNKHMSENDKYEEIYNNIVVNGKTLEINAQFTLGLPVQDNAMAPIGIMKNNTVVVMCKEKYENNDIVLIKKKKMSNILVARKVLIINKNIFLIALQEEESEWYDTLKHDILGKIIQVNKFIF